MELFAQETVAARKAPDHSVQITNALGPVVDPVDTPPRLKAGDSQFNATRPQGLRTTFPCVFEGFSRELSSHYMNRY